MAEDDAAEEEEPRLTESTWQDYFNPKVPLGLVAVVAVALLLGGMAILLAQNAADEQTIRFSTLGLIGFVLSVGIGGASIVLAISAIGLGRASEQAMTRRSDASIKLQNDVFIQTTEALRRIQSSTDVTGKRIEDIFAGRAGAISEKVAETVAPDADATELREQIRKSLLEELRTEREVSARQDDKSDAARHKDERRSENEDYTQQALITISNADQVTAEKLGVGDAARSGLAAVDGVFSYEGRRFVVVVTLQAYAEDWGVPSWRRLLNTVVQLLAEGSVNTAFFVGDSDITTLDNVGRAWASIKQVTRSEVIREIHFLGGDPEVLQREVVRIMKESPSNEGKESDPVSQESTEREP